MSQVKIDTGLFNDFFFKDENTTKKFVDFLEFAREKYPNIIKKDGKTIIIDAEIDIDLNAYNSKQIRNNLHIPLICDNITFNNKVHFNCFNFVSDVSFKNCIFEQKADFSNIKFQKNVYFNNSIFYGYSDFHECEFEKNVCFYGATFKKMPNFSACYFKDKNFVNLIGLNIETLDFKKIETYIIENFQDENFIKEKEHINHLYTKQCKIDFKEEQLIRKYQLKYAQNIKDSFRAIKDILITQNNALEAQNWHKLELYAKEKEIEIGLESEYEGVVQNYTAWIDCILLKLYKNTSEHHTNLLKMLNFTIGMVAVYYFVLVSSRLGVILLQIDKVYRNFILFAIVFLFAFFIPIKPKMRLMTLVVVALIFIVLTTTTINMDFELVQATSLICYLMCLIFFYFLFTCKYRFVVFLINLVSWTTFTMIIISTPQLINPFIGVFSSEKLFESRLEKKLSNLNANAIINLAKISQNDFTLQYTYNIPFAELNAAKKVIIDNKDNLIGLKDKDSNKLKCFLGDTLYSEILQAMNQDEILSDSIKSTSIIYSIILLLCIFSLQKTARKNSIVPS